MNELLKSERKIKHLINKKISEYGDINILKNI